MSLEALERFKKLQMLDWYGSRYKGPIPTSILVPFIFRIIKQVMLQVMNRLSIKILF